MIFLTVGTHEQPFDRVVKALDELKEQNKITRDIFIQTGYSEYKPRFCQFEAFIGFERILQYMREADIVMTHGGTGSVMLALYNNKIPLVVPRQKRFNEHIDDHQVYFTRMMTEKGKIMAVYEMEELERTLRDYPERVREMQGSEPGRNIDRLNEQAAAISHKIEERCAQWFNR